MGAASSAGFSSSHLEHTTVVATEAPLSHAAIRQNLGHRGLLDSTVFQAF